jgi:transketolase
LNEGEDIGLITSGITTLEGIKAVEILSRKGIQVRHLHVSSIKPIDKNELVKTAVKTKLIVTVENQSIIGGLGGAVSEVLGEMYPTKIIRLGLQDHFGETATLRYMMHKYGIDSENIVKVISHALDR